MLLIIDNYDSFTFNLVQYFGELNQEVTVKRNDEISIKEIEKLSPDAIVISPGPCTPKESGISNEVIKYFSGKKPILGICLGHQCIGYCFGSEIKSAKKIVHGKTSQVFHNNIGMFRGLENPVRVARYHSLVVAEAPQDFIITAYANDEEERVIMGMRHKTLPIESVQFHPESFLTENGRLMLANFLTEFLHKA